MKAVGVNRLNAVIHERARLWSMSALAARSAITFMELKSLLGMTDENLSIHLRILEKAKYVLIDKRFIDRRPCTTVRLSKNGRIAFGHTLDVLEEIVGKR